MVESVDHKIESWLPDITRIAMKFRGRAGAELDDLVQEGMISVWKALDSGACPSKTAIKNRMIDWCRYLDKNHTNSYEVVVDHAEISLH
jgi:DNA-directed RNA polymerase specialized sigma subunit